MSQGHVVADTGTGIAETDTAAAVVVVAAAVVVVVVVAGIVSCLESFRFQS